MPALSKPNGREGRRVQHTAGAGYKEKGRGSVPRPFSSRLCGYGAAKMLTSDTLFHMFVLLPCPR
jgi:hypothetical protein